MVGLAAKDLNKNGAIYYLLPLAHSANFYLFDRRNMKKNKKSLHFYIIDQEAKHLIQKL